jgi:hypothetical protein
MRLACLLCLAIALSLPVAGCGDSGAESAADVLSGEADVGGGNAFELFSEAGLDRVLSIASFGCRDDALFVAVRAAEMTGIYKMETAHPELGWRQIYNQEALLEPTKDALAVVLPAGKS